MASYTVYGETMTMDGMQWQAVVTYDLAVTATTNTLSNISIKIRYKGTATKATGAIAVMRVGYTKAGASLVGRSGANLVTVGASASSGASQSSWAYSEAASADGSVTVNTASGQQLYVAIDIGHSATIILKLYNSGTTYTDNIDTVLDHHVNKLAELTYFSKPQITAISAVRCDAQGVDDDEGAYARISATWSVDSAAPSNVGTVTGTITPQGGTASPLTITSGGSGTSGTAAALADNLDADTQYTVTITVTDLVGVTSRNVIITRAFFIMDFKAGGQGIGIGRAAPESGLEVGYDATFDADVLMREGLSVNGTLEQGTGTTADSSDQVTLGKYNVSDADDTYALIIGNGTSDSNRSNAFAVDWNGRIYVDDHDSPIGTVLDTGSVTYSGGMVANTMKQGASLSLTAGTWLLVGLFTFGTASTSGTRNISCDLFKGTVSGTTIRRQRVVSAAANESFLQVIGVVAPTSTTSYSVGGSSSVATGQARYSSLTAVRIA